MKIDNIKNLRLGIYVFYDPEGIVDRYVDYFLQDLTKNLSELLIVCNGTLTPEGRSVFRKFTDKIICRENTGYDIWGYKTGIDYYGWEKLSGFDEVVLVNSSIMGPVYPFSEMFENMAQRDVDFWGITRHYGSSLNPYDTPYGYLPEHIQSYFMVFRKDLIRSIDFQLYWNNLPQLKDYKQVVGLFESYFTKYFSDKGFVWEVYVDDLDLKNNIDSSLFIYPQILIKEKRCPIFKRRTFFTEYGYYMMNSDGHCAVDLYEYLRDHSNYDIDMIWENVLRTCHLIDLCRNLALTYVLPEKYDNVFERHRLIDSHRTKKIALLMHFYYNDLVEYYLHYAQSMPEQTDIYITTDTISKKNHIINLFRGLKCNHLEVRIVPNRGRDISAFLIGLSDVIDNYDYICRIHDKKTLQMEKCVGDAFRRCCTENTLASSEYVAHILNLFEENPKLGILCPPILHFRNYFSILGREWTNCFAPALKLAKKMKITVPISIDKPPLAPFGTCFWFRAQALKALFELDWKYDDMPQEPVVRDGTILHAIERLYPYVAQQAGFYSAYAMADSYARIELTNLNYSLREYNRALLDNHYEGLQPNMCQKLRSLAKSNRDLQEQNNQLLNEKENLTCRLTAILSSRSWKITEPIRKLASFLLPYHSRRRNLTKKILHITN